MLARKLKVVSSTSEQKAIYNSVKRFAQEGLNDLIRVLMESVDDALYELSDKVENDRERNMYFEAMREIRLKRDGMMHNFEFEIERNFDAFVKGKSANDSFDEDEELSLVELDDMEDNIAINNMVTRARPHFEDDLFALKARFEAVLNREHISEDENPLDPKAICDCFHNASDLLQTDIQAKLIFYKLFERYVMSHLGHFYEELNELFIKKGVLPEFKPDQERDKQRTRFMANRIRQNSSTSSATTSPVTGVAPPGDAATDAEVTLYTALQQAISSLSGSAGSASFGGIGTGIQPGPVVDSTGMEQVTFLNALSDLQASNIPKQPLASIDPQNFKLQSQQQLIDFRQQYQHKTNSDDSQTIDVVSMLFDFFFDDEALPAPIKVLIGRLQIPILKLAIIDKDFFNQKKHPARKLLDSISQASLGWSTNQDDERALIDKIEEVVNFVLNKFEKDVAIFEKALNSFENFLRKKDAETQKAEQLLRNEEQKRDRHIQTAQDAAANLVSKLTTNRDISAEVIDFLETTWTSVLFNAYLSLGETSNHWRNLKRISTTLVWTLIPKFTEDERSKIIKTIPALLRALSKGMALINIGAKDQNQIFKMLAQEHARIVKLTSKNIVTRIDDSTVWPDDRGAAAMSAAQALDRNDDLDFEISEDDSGSIVILANEIDDESITVISATDTDEVIDNLNQFTTNVKNGNIKVDEEIVLNSDGQDDFDLLVGEAMHLEQAQRIEIGDWAEFIESPSNTIAARLSWKSKVTGSFVFTNSHGAKVRNLSINDFARELHKGSAKIIQSASVFDRAIHTIMSKTQH